MRDMVNNKEIKLHQLFESLSSIDGDLLADVSPANPAPSVQREGWQRWQRYATVAAAVLVVVAGGFIWNLFFNGSMESNGGAAPMDYESAAERGGGTQFGGTAGSQAVVPPGVGPKTNDLDEGPRTYDSIDQLVHDSHFIFRGVLLWTEEAEDSDEWYWEGYTVTQSFKGVEKNEQLRIAGLLGQEKKEGSEYLVFANDGQMSFEILNDNSLDLSSVSDPSLLSILVRDCFDHDYARLIETSLASIEDP